MLAAQGHVKSLPCRVRRPPNRSLLLSGQHGSVLCSSDADEGGTFSHSIAYEPLLGGGLLRQQGNRARSIDRGHCDYSLWIGCTLFAYCLAVVARNRAAGRRSGQDVPHRVAELRGGAAVAGLWLPGTAPRGGDLAKTCL